MPITIEQFLNPLSQSMHPQVLESLRDSMTSQLDAEHAYRVAFPVYLDAAGPVSLVCLLCEATDPRIRMILSRNALRPIADPPPSHIFLCQGYADQRQWLKQAKGIIRFFPEQPDCKEVLMSFDGK